MSRLPSTLGKLFKTDNINLDRQMSPLVSAKRGILPTVTVEPPDSPRMNLIREVEQITLS